MATKTISVDLEAYERLRAARLSPSESFSKVIKRARWDAAPFTARAYVEACGRVAPIDRGVLVRLDEAQRADQPPDDPWLSG